MNILNAKLFIAKLMMKNSAFRNNLLPTKSKKLQTIFQALINAGMKPIKINSPSIYCI